MLNDNVDSGELRTISKYTELFNEDVDKYIMQIDTNPQSARRSIRSSYPSPRDGSDGRARGPSLFHSLDAGGSAGRAGRNGFDFVTALATDPSRGTDRGRQAPFHA